MLSFYTGRLCIKAFVERLLYLMLVASVLCPEALDLQFIDQPLQMVNFSSWPEGGITSICVIISMG